LTFLSREVINFLNIYVLTARRKYMMKSAIHVNPKAQFQAALTEENQ